MRRIKKLEELNTDPVNRNHVGEKQRFAVLAEHILDVCTWIGGTHFERTLQQRKTKHFLIPMDCAFDVGYADADMVYSPRIN
jgi:hypothetical protein